MSELSNTTENTTAKSLVCSVLSSGICLHYSGSSIGSDTAGSADKIGCTDNHRHVVRDDMHRARHSILLFPIYYDPQHRLKSNDDVPHRSRVIGVIQINIDPLNITANVPATNDQNVGESDRSCTLSSTQHEQYNSTFSFTQDDEAALQHYATAFGGILSPLVSTSSGINDSIASDVDEAKLHLSSMETLYRPNGRKPSAVNSCVASQTKTLKTSMMDLFIAMTRDARAPLYDDTYHSFLKRANADTKKMSTNKCNGGKSATLRMKAKDRARSNHCGNNAVTAHEGYEYKSVLAEFLTDRIASKQKRKEDGDDSHDACSSIVSITQKMMAFPFNNCLSSSTISEFDDQNVAGRRNADDYPRCYDSDGTSIYGRLYPLLIRRRTQNFQRCARKLMHETSVGPQRSHNDVVNLPSTASLVEVDNYIANLRSCWERSLQMNLKLIRSQDSTPADSTHNKLRDKENKDALIEHYQNINRQLRRAWAKSQGELRELKQEQIRKTEKIIPPGQNSQFLDQDVLTDQIDEYAITGNRTGFSPSVRQAQTQFHNCRNSTTVNNSNDKNESPTVNFYHDYVHLRQTLEKFVEDKRISFQSMNLL